MSCKYCKNLEQNSTDFFKSRAIDFDDFTLNKSDFIGDISQSVAIDLQDHLESLGFDCEIIQDTNEQDQICDNDDHCAIKKL